MAKQAWETIVAFKLVWLRTVGYFAVPAWLMWETLTKDISGANWDAMHSFDRFCLIGRCVAAGVIAFLAFIDQSTARATTDLENGRHRRSTSQIDTGP